MTAEVSFVIPFRTDGGEREKLYRWNKLRLLLLFPKCEIITCDSDPDLPFNLSAARNSGIREATREFIANVDSDTIWNPNIIETCLDAMANNAHWMIPYMSYRALTPESTEALMGDGYGTYINSHNLSYEYIKDVTNDEIYPPQSGLTFYRRSDLTKVGGFDERFIGWGWEDREMVTTSDRILGPHARIHENVYHMWHPRGDADVHQPKYQDNWRRYDECVAYENYSYSPERHFL